ncbi:hypothetical protein RZS08_42505, partial [Arthrospira platensis SPKY1]|nr:hypothetical protein [Arthrospira platensis SPKY1]
AQRAHLLDDVVQLSYVPRPVGNCQHLQGVAGEAGFRLAVAAGERAQEVLGEKRDVLATPRQRRDLQADDIDAVIEVFAELTAAQGLLEVAVGRRQDAQVDRRR